MKIIVVEAEHGYDNCDSCGYSGDVTVQTHDSILPLLKNNEIKQQLIQAGWVPLKDIKEVADKVALENKFYLANGFHAGYLREVDLTALDTTVANAIANNGMLLQKVDPKSVLSPEQYKVVATAIQRNKNIEKGRATAAKKRSYAAKQKKLAEAKKMLQDAGQLPLDTIHPD